MESLFPSEIFKDRENYCVEEWSHCCLVKFAKRKKKYCVEEWSHCWLVKFTRGIVFYRIESPCPFEFVRELNCHGTSELF